MTKSADRRFSFRFIPWLVAGLLAGAVLVQPAVAHLGSFSHLKSHFLNKTTVKVVELELAAGERDYAVAECPGDMQVLGGGVSSTAALGETTMHNSSPVIGGSFNPGAGTYAKATAWFGEATNTGGTDETISVYAICARPSR